MANIDFLSARLSDAAAIAASSAVATLPVTNLQDPQPKRVYRSTTLTGVYITWAFPVGIAADMLAVVRPNFTDAATWRLRGANSSGAVTAAPVVDTTSVSVWPVTGKPTDPSIVQQICALRFANSTALTHWRLDLTDAANPDGYFNIGVAILGQRITTTHNFSYGANEGDEPADVVVTTPYGITLPEERDNPRTLSLPWKILPKADLRGGLGEMLRERKTSKPFLVCTDPDETTYAHVVTRYGSRVGSTSHEFVHPQRMGTTLKHREWL